MECEGFNELLMDLVYDDLDEVRTAAMRKHMEGCAECSRLHMSLTQGRSFGAKLEMLAAPALSVDVIAALEPAPAPALVVSPPIEPVMHEGGAPRWLRTLGEIAMRRQVAMAAVFLVMVGFGLRYAHHATTENGNLVTEAPEGSNPVVIPATELPRPHVAPENTAPVVQGGAAQQHRTAVVAHRPTVTNSARPTPPTNNPVALPSHDDTVATTPSVNPVVAPTPAPPNSAMLPSAMHRDPTTGPVGPVPNTQNFRGIDPYAEAVTQAERFHAGGDRSQEIVALRRAYDLAPTETERTDRYLSLHSALARAGRQAEANELAAERIRHTNGPSLADQLPQPNAAPSVAPPSPPPGANAPVAAPPSAPSGNSVPHASTVRPTTMRPASRSPESNAAPGQAYRY